MMKSIHDMQVWVFYFPKQKICAQRCGRISLERMAIVEIMLLKEFLPFPVIPRAQNYRECFQRILISAGKSEI